MVLVVVDIITRKNADETVEIVKNSTSIPIAM
jgi:hypothetical protein